MAEELSLPRIAWATTSESFSTTARKRVRLSSPPISSDPAIFSSDDDPSADNYTQERRKKKFRGPWYHQRPASEAGSVDSHEPEHKKGKRRFERQFDSGVFMGSDGTDMDLEEFEDGPTALPLRQSRMPQTRKAVSTPEELARGLIQRCLEDGDESIDLSYVISMSESTIVIGQRIKSPTYLLFFNADLISQFSRPYDSSQCHYPTPRSIYTYPACCRRSLLPTRT